MLQKFHYKTLVFLFSIITVGFTLFSLIFPAFLVRVSSGISYSQVNPYETGIFTIPFLITTCIFLVLVIVYKKSDNSVIHRGLSIVKQFDISSRISLMILLLMLIVYIGFTSSEIFEDEIWGDYYNVILPQVENFEPENIDRRTLDNVILHTSFVLFDNFRLLPFISSIVILALVYFFTNNITGKNFPGLISTILLMQSNVFLTYDSTATYTNFWCLFYLLSLFLILKKSPISIMAYLSTIFTKPLTLLYLPITFLFIYELDIPRKNKKILYLTYIVTSAALIFLITQIFSFVSLTPVFDMSSFWSSFSISVVEIRYDYVLLFTIGPVLFLLYQLSKKNILLASSMMLIITMSLLMHPIASAIGYGIFPYRFVPLVMFYAIGVGMLFSDRFNR